MTDDTSKSTAEARAIEARSTKTRISPPKSELGEPKRKFSETFKAVTLYMEKYPFLNTRKDNGEHE